MNKVICGIAMSVDGFVAGPEIIWQCNPLQYGTGKLRRDRTCYSYKIPFDT